VAIAGLVVLPVVPWIIRAFAAADRGAARWGLSPSRVDALRATQARSVDVAMADRRQIERDLHDGAQQRLLSLGMELGMALEKSTAIRTRPAASSATRTRSCSARSPSCATSPAGSTPPSSPTAGSTLPSRALAARSPIPVRLDVKLAERPPASVEATAYFVVAEALTNAARYAKAKHVDVKVRQDGDKLHIEVTDDGVGGAEQRPGGGLAGLADRASSVEGSLRVSSPHPDCPPLQPGCQRGDRT
jgi:signal transduction histidine kinase